jgi:hypothetical protein
VSNNQHALVRGLGVQHTSNSDRPALHPSFVTHENGTDTLLRFAEEQKSSFHNVWDGIHENQKRALRFMLLRLAAEEGNQGGRALWLSAIEGCLRAQDDHNGHDGPNNNDGHENDVYATKVATFVAVLGGLSAQGIREMHDMTQSPTTEIVLDNESEGPDTSSYYTALSVINSCATTAECTDSADEAGRAGSANDAHGLVMLMGFGVLVLTMLVVLSGPKRHTA